MPAFSLNCVMRFSQPRRATQLKIQASSAWPETWLWLKTMCFCGSMPEAMKAAVTSRVFLVSSVRVLEHGDGVQIDHAIKAIVLGLERHEFGDGAEIIAEMQVAGRLHAREDAGLGLGLLHASALT